MSIFTAWRKSFLTTRALSRYCLSDQESFNFRILRGPARGSAELKRCLILQRPFSVVFVGEKNISYFPFGGVLAANIKETPDYFGERRWWIFGALIWRIRSFLNLRIQSLRMSREVVKGDRKRFLMRRHIQDQHFTGDPQSAECSRLQENGGQFIYLKSNENRSIQGFNRSDLLFLCIDIQYDDSL
ncbi:hypothetical protein CEXT_804481 [Caerostris extrusa]|uniref:Uncharacterized protein n=1 Tax=Caerostris extrusa TaxID=172846 RepID=A0AAV4P022_CAEEX|nr:hypothetical protein CEXT_804481 [Caerostris extrusa]